MNPITPDHETECSPQNRITAPNSMTVLRQFAMLLHIIFCFVVSCDRARPRCLKYSVCTITVTCAFISVPYISDKIKWLVWQVDNKTVIFVSRRNQIGKNAPTFCYHKSMTIYFSHDTALEYWRSPSGRRSRTNDAVPNLPASSLDLAQFRADWLAIIGMKSLPIHATIGDARKRIARPDTSLHVWPGPIPAGSFERITEQWWVSSPELCFYQMAARLTFIQTVYMGYELCARYRRNPFAEGGLEHPEPLTSVASIRDYGEHFGARKGAKPGRVALRYVADGAASPMEVAAAMLFTLPRHYGGYGLPRCLLNPDTVVNDVARKSTRTLHGDLVWPAQRVIVEYESDEFHLDTVKFAQDSARRNVLIAAGWKVMTLTRGQVQDESACDRAAAQLTHLLGVRQHAAPRGMDLMRSILREEVLP